MNEYWKKIKKRYDAEESFADQNAEDMVSRRVLKALGVTTKKLPYLEKELFGERYVEPLWCRARRLLYESVDESNILRRRSVDVLEDFSTFKNTIDRLKTLLAESPIYFVRIKKTNRVYAVFCIHNSSIIEILEPPFTVLKGIENYWICQQNILNFLKKQI